jgi:RimJ/RimL family protein N-acetyltransferase
MVPILRDFPDHFETERLLVRSPRPGDGIAVYEAVAETIEELRAWPASLPWALHDPSPEQSEIFCRRGHSAFLARTDLPMLIFLRESHAFVGGTGLHRFDWAVPKFEVGFWGRNRYRGHGLISEAVRGAVAFAKRELTARRLECFSDEQNNASRRVAERCAFVLEGIMRNERVDPDGTLRSTCVYAIAT